MSIETPPAAARLYSLQALRGLAVLMVVIYHAAEIWHDITGQDRIMGVWDHGWVAVDMFFVISGFVLVWVGAQKPHGVRPAVRFAIDRMTRIYPLWWIFCGLMGVYFFVTYGQPASPVQFDAGGAWMSLLKSLALWPQSGLPVLAVGWTLIFEFGFYMLFSALILVPARFRPWILLVWGVVLVFNWVTGTDSPALPGSWSATLLHPLCLDFLIGALIAYILRRMDLPLSVCILATLAGLLGFAATMMWSDPFGLDAVLRERVLTAGIPSGLLVLGLVGWERQGGIKWPPLFVRLGDASYSLYLAHMFVLLALKRVVVSTMGGLPPSLGSLLLFIVIGTGVSAVASIFIYRGLERPLLTLSRRPFRTQKADAPSG